MTAMPVAFHDASLLRAWVQAARHVASPNAPSFVMIVSADVAWNPTAQYLRNLNLSAERYGWERPGTVSDMILPRVISGSQRPTREAIEVGLRMFGRGRARGARYSGWIHTYFERMAGASIDASGVRHELRTNKLLGVVDKLNLWNRNVESACYVHIDLPTDGFRTRGGPCLQYVQFRAHGDRQLSVAALYRAHDYGNKALGNLIGLDRLGRFVAGRTARTFSGVSVVSLHPFCEGKIRLRQFTNDVAGMPGF